MTSTHDNALEEEVQHWVESVLKEPFPEGMTFAEALKDGTRLCRLINEVQPGSVKKVNQSAMMFKQMENISLFLAACRSLGVPSFDCFETNDLFQEKNMQGVLRCLDSLGRTVQTNCPSFPGPHLGAKMATKNERHFDPALLNASKGAVNKLNMGSSAFMERKAPDISASVTFGNECVGASTTDAPTFLTTGNSTGMRSSPKKTEGGREEIAPPVPGAGAVEGGKLAE
ncbi:hypothetical protein VYU27_003600 [Nannochloropsis oceanica]